jgi:hypothetical protein
MTPASNEVDETKAKSSKEDVPLSIPPLSVTVQQAEVPAGKMAADVEDATKYVAVLVCHGMGQQVQFETLDSVARGVEGTARSSGVAVDGNMTVSLHPNDGHFMGRAELKLTDTADAPVEAHFFEAYWAPLTEGKVTLMQTLAFLRGAGIRGMWFALRDGVFDRWMFGRRQEFQIPAQRVLQLGLALWILIIIGVSFSALALIPVLKLAALFRGVSNPDLASAAAVSYSLALSIGVTAIVAVPVAWILRSRQPEPPPAVNAPVGSLAPAFIKRVGMLIVVLAVIALVSWATVIIGFWMYRSWLFPVAKSPSSHPYPLLAAALVFAIELVALRIFTQRFLIQFVGDVAAYISPFEVSTFEEVRHAIQDRARTVAKFIYESAQPRYTDVYIVGHSLGSVIAYDALNDAINRDEIANAWATGSKSGALDVVERTRLLLTFGSPLDKTAFIFRTQKSNSKVDLREALATLVQPLVADYANRSGKWLNLWSPSDWISGRLTYYDSPAPAAGQGLCNLKNKNHLFPWVAHTSYWKDPLFSGVLFSALTGRRALTLSLVDQANVLNALGLAIPVA